MQTTKEIEYLLLRYTGKKNIAELETKVSIDCEIESIFGCETTYLHPAETAKKTEYNAYFAVVNLFDVITSNNPLKSFESNSEFIQEIQDRNYSRKSEQSKVIEIAAKLNPKYLLSLCVTAAEGSPIITPQGICLSGNARTMALQYATKHYSKQYQNYIHELKESSWKFALLPDEISSFEFPILVRIVDVSILSEQIEFGRIANTKIGASRSEFREASYYAELIPNDLLLLLKGADEKAMSALIEQRTFVNFLLCNIPTKEHQNLFDDAQRLTDTGKAYIKRILLIKCLGDVECLENMSKTQYRLFEASIPALIEFRQRESKGEIIPRFSISNLFSQSIKFYYQQVDCGGYSDYQDFETQNCFGFVEKKKPEKRVHEFLKVLDYMSKPRAKTKIFKRFLTELISAVTGESGLSAGLLNVSEEPLYKIISEVFQQTK